MTPERAKALEAVAVAARVWLNVSAQLPYQDQRELDAMDVCEKALTAYHALDALPAEPVGETVDVRAVVKRARGTDIIHVYGRSDLTDTEMVNWAPGNEVVAFTTARVPLPTIPVIAARVEG